MSSQGDSEQNHYMEELTGNTTTTTTTTTTMSTSTTATDGGSGLSAVAWAAIIGVIVGILGVLLTLCDRLCWSNVIGRWWTSRESPRRDMKDGQRMSSPGDSGTPDPGQGQAAAATEPDLRQDLASQQSSITPISTQVEIQKLSVVGDRTTIIVGSGTTVTQHVNQNVTGTPDPDTVQDVARKTKEALKTRYKTTGSFVQMLPWVDDNKLHIMDIYTKLSLVEQVDKVGKIDKEKKKMESYEEIFHLKTREGDPIKRGVISGSAGIGKTTLIDKIAYDWAMGKSETLNKYELVFVFKMRSLEQSSDLMDAIFDQPLNKDSVDKSVLKEFIDNNPEKVLILLDGFDEFQTKTFDVSSFGSILKVLKRKQGRECWVVVTSRPSLDTLVSSLLVEKPFTHVKVEGFSDTDIEEYANKFFPEDHDNARRLLEWIKLSDTLSDLAKSPMLLLMMCLLWAADNTLPDTMTQLYNKALKYIFKRKTRDIGEDAMSKILIAIGKVAIDGLISTNRSFSYCEEDFKECKSALDAGMSAGILTSEMVIDGLDTYQRVYFIHLTFLEYCAAMYWKSLIKTSEFNIILNHMYATPMARSTLYEHLLRFCCGDNKACTDLILQKLCKYPRDQRLVVICYFESQSEKQPSGNSIRLVLSSCTHLYDWNRDCINAFIYFLRRVTGHAVGNKCLAMVNTLRITSCNIQRVSEDLANSIKLMTNLEHVELSYCSLTAVNTGEILSSLASPTLAELDISGNKALGSSLSLLAPHWTKLKLLQKLSLRGCSLLPRDLKPIAESLSDTPTLVYLDLSKNTDLGDCPSTNWAVHLKQMEHLEELDLSMCSLKDKHIEHIAEVLNDMPNLVDLDLSSNDELGDCASLWAKALKQMQYVQKLNLSSCKLKDKNIHLIASSMNDMPSLVLLNLGENYDLGDCVLLWAISVKQMQYVQKLNLSSCKLKDKDIHPIASSMYDMTSLVHLNLGKNYDLGDCALLWATHLKHMKHIKNLILEDCKLTGSDIRPIAESLTSMPTLVQLDLSENYALGGHASKWAPSLKKMNHLKELLFRKCDVTGGDMEPIAESMSEMPNLIRLDLSHNVTLRGCASSWAPHLKQMTKHLKKLSLPTIFLTDEDQQHITASIGFNSPIMKSH